MYNVFVVAVAFVVVGLFLYFWCVALKINQLLLPLAFFSLPLFLLALLLLQLLLLLAPHVFIVQL